MNNVPPSIVQRLERDSTIRLSCRKGEYVVWVATDSLFASNTASSWDVRDFWEMRDGDYVTITNRMVDLPGWLELHPVETAGRAAFEMAKRLKEGFKPKEIMDGPNLWRIRAGDRLVWVSPLATENPIKSVLDFRSCAMVIGENAVPRSFGENTFFGAPENETLSQTSADLIRSGINAAISLGSVRVYASEWRFGA